MADDVQLSAAVGAGVTAAADAILGVYYQRLKLIHGIDGVNDGDVAKTNPLPTRQTGATPTTANVGASAASVTVLAANANRMRAWLYNDSTSNCYIKYGAAASNASFTKLLLPNEFFTVDGYTGIIDAIWAVAAGNMRVTEVTP